MLDVASARETRASRALGWLILLLSVTALFPISVLSYCLCMPLVDVESYTQAADPWRPILVELTITSVIAESSALVLVIASLVIKPLRAYRSRAWFAGATIALLLLLPIGLYFLVGLVFRGFGA